MDELRPFQDPDLSLLQAGSTCLAKHQDGLWHPARILGEAGVGTSLVGFYSIRPFLESPFSASCGHFPSPLDIETPTGPKRSKSGLSSALPHFPLPLLLLTVACSSQLLTCNPCLSPQM